MVINYEKKIIFIGIPFSASSAISKELIERYKFEPLFHKHSNIPVLLKNRPDINLTEYTIVAVKRDPVDIAFTFYNKIKNNAHNVYTDSKYFIENGGHVTKKARRIYNQMRNKQWTFEQYVENVYRFIPYDNFLSFNRPYINFEIDYKYIERDFQKLLNNSSIISQGPLPIYNKTVKAENKPALSLSIIKKAFGPFLYYNKFDDYQFSLREIGYLRFTGFKFIQFLRSIYWLMRDKRQSKNMQFNVD